MAATAKWRGHRIVFEGGVWVYVDSKKPVSNDPARRCGFCKKENRKDDHDACLGVLDGVMNACCGHGVSEDAYIQFDDKSVRRGAEAILIIESKRV